MSKKSHQKTGYRVTNWSAYNKSLVNRGDITFWFSEEVLANWKHSNKGFKVGRPFLLAAVDPDSHQIVAEVLTGNDCHDSERLWIL